MLVRASWIETQERPWNIITSGASMLVRASWIETRISGYYLAVSVSMLVRASWIETFPIFSSSLNAGVDAREVVVD